MERTYTPEEIKSAEQMARAIRDAPENQRNAFRMMVDAMLVGASITQRPATERPRTAAGA